ncbi:hypothetical protein [Shimazuella kribbensis]|uniref:hypothetical protein n=1 Tax=Shimazuella kribbensis TaxID=139808 RepID=UPI0003F714E3|nr:hypothetical protein [Shimazuella kribbensis]
MSEEKTVFNFNGATTGNIIGENMTNVTMNNNVYNQDEKKNKEELVQEVLTHYTSYMNQIDQLELSKEEKKEMRQAVHLFQEEIREDEPDVQKLQTYTSTLEKSSQVFLICGAIFSLMQLFQ